MFADQPGQWDCEVTSSPDRTFNYGHTDDAALSDFFSRPIKIYSADWVVGTSFVARLDPWSLFFENKRVINRINNYNLLRCKLKIKIVINGTAFHYGRIMVSYLPLYPFDGVSSTRTGVSADLVEFSQRPHVFLNPTYSQGASMSLPFFYHKNWISIPESRWNEMGILYMDDFGILKHANGADSPVNVSVFAHAEDVIISVPTTINTSSLTNQSADEYGKPIISRPATSVAAAMGMLSSAPVIGPYARATEMIATTVASIASAFGYSRPTVITDPTHMRPLTYGNLTNTDAADTSFKTSLDSKQELTVDSRTVGLSGNDEMSIKSIATRSSYLTSIAWATTNIAEDHLFSVYVTPALYTNYNNELHMTALDFAANPFKYWRGTIKYRFQIVCSSFHKGRIKIVYDPGTMAASTSEYNIAYTRIVDISQETDFEIDVGWGNERSYLSLRNITDLFPCYSNTILSLDRDQTNGTLSVFVVNDLTTPSTLTNNDIYINVYVSGCDDIEFAVPTDAVLGNLSYFSNQSGNGQMCDDCPDYAPVLDTIAEDSVYEETNKVFFGESIRSFRNCLKRYQYHSALAQSTSQSTTDYYSVFTSQNFPLYPGLATNGIHLSGTTPCNIVHNTLLHYLTPAYTGLRGSIRYKIRPMNTAALSVGNWTVYRSDDEYVQWTETLADFQVPATYTQSQFAAQNLRAYHSLWNGSVVTAAAGAVPALEYELVHYDNQRFMGAKNILLSANDISPGKYCNTVVTQVRGTSAFDILSRMVSVGEDFTLFFYTGPPIAYAYNLL